MPAFSEHRRSSPSLNEIRPGMGASRSAVRRLEEQRRMIERTQETFGIWPERLAADTAYGSAENLAWLVHERGIEPHIPFFDKSARQDGTFERRDFTYDHVHDLYVCPGGRELKQQWRKINSDRPNAPSDT